MKGYWEDQARTNEVMVQDADGTKWMHVSLPPKPPENHTTITHHPKKST